MEDEKQKNVEKLKRLCSDAIAKYPTKDVTGDGIPETFCNFGLQYIAAGMGYSGFGGMAANQICTVLDVSENWRQCDAVLAQNTANEGKLAVAALRDDPHGHVAVCYPGEIQRSAKWGKLCPTVANVGKDNFIRGANFAFGQEPKYFVLKDRKEVGQ